MGVSVRLGFFATPLGALNSFLNLIEEIGKDRTLVAGQLVLFDVTEDFLEAFDIVGR